MAGVTTQFSIQDRMTSRMNTMINASERLNRSLDVTDRLTDTIDPGAPFEQSAAPIAAAGRQVDDFNERQRRAENGADKVKSIWSGMGGIIRGALAAFSAKKIIDLADSMTTTRARLDLMNDGLQTTSKLQDMIMASANRSRASYQATADAVSKMGIMAKDAFNSNGELIAFSELINKQFTIAGTSAAGIDAAMLQLTQAMSSGVLRGEELNSVFEQAPTIIQTIATWIATGAAQAFFTTLLTNPLFWIALAIGVVVAAIYKWVQSVGGLKIAWLIAVNAILTAWDWVKIGFMTGVYWVMNMWNKLQLAFYTAGVNIQNFMGDMKAGVLMILQNMVNGAIDIINGFINILNKIPGVNIGLIEQVTFGTTAQLENEAKKQARAADLAAYQDQINSQIADRDAALGAMKSEARAATAQREAEIAAKRAEAAAAGNGSNEPDWAAYAAGAGDIGNVGHVGSVGKVDEDVNIADEDLKFLRDVAEMRYVQNFVTLTPTVAVDAKISEKVDVDEVVSRIESKLEDEFTAAAEGVYA